jgi:hypothetical protein
MRWKTYATLTKEQKEEYDFRFVRNPLHIDISMGTIWPITAFFMTFIVIVFMCYLGANDEKFSYIKPHVTEYMYAAGTIFQAVSWILVIVVSVQLIALIWRGFQAYLFFRKVRVGGKK